MSRYYRRYYGGGKPKPKFNDKGKLIRISYCDEIDLKNLEKQKKIYLKELEDIKEIFSEEKNKKEKNECEVAKKKLRPLLQELLKESKNFDKSFYNETRTYFEDKKIFSKNIVTAEIRLHSKDESNSDKFLKIAESIVKNCDKINEYDQFNSRQYEKLNKFYKEHDLGIYEHCQSEPDKFFDKNFDFNDMKILNVRFDESYSKLYPETCKIDGRFSAFFLASKCAPHVGYKGFGKWIENKVDYVPSEPVTNFHYYNNSQFMKKFIKLSEGFEINFTPPYIEAINPGSKTDRSSYKKKALDIIEKFLRKIELATRAKKKGKEKIENIGYVYVFSNESLPPNTYKIGSTYGLPEERAEELTGTGHLTPFKVAGKIKIQSAEYYEKSIHKLLTKYRVKKNKEFFELELDKIKDCFKQVSELSDKGEKKLTSSDLKKSIKI